MPSSELGLSPTPHPQASVPPPLCFWGEGNARWRERGCGESQFRRGAYTVVLFICTYFVLLQICISLCSLSWTYGSVLFITDKVVTVYLDSGRILGGNWDNSLKSFFFSSLLFTVTSADEFYSPSPPPRAKVVCFKLVCNVHIVYRNLKSEESQDYAQKPQLHCMFMNSAFGSSRELSTLSCVLSRNIQYVQ
jgi:hypothetical protein